MTPLRVGQEAYWLDQIARERCEYYSGKNESPGWWAGSVAERAACLASLTMRRCADCSQVKTR